jgi:invasion protein IalB
MSRMSGSTQLNMKAMMMMRKLLSLLAVTALAAGLVTSQATAQETTSTPDQLTETYGNWTLRCGPGETRCHVSQSLFRAEDKARLLQVTLFSPPGADGAMFFRSMSPLGAILTDGVALIVDDAEPVTAQYISCWPRGCMAEVPAKLGLLTALRAGKQLAVQVKSAETGQTIRFELSLEGISAALDRFGEMK